MLADSDSIQSRMKFEPINPAPPVTRMVFFINLGTRKFHKSTRMEREEGIRCAHEAARSGNE